MRLLVIGYKLYNNDEHLNAVLDFFAGVNHVEGVMGDPIKDGAARLAQEWAKHHHVPFGPYSYAPDVVLAFGGTKRVNAAALDFARSGYKVLDARTGQQVTA